MLDSHEYEKLGSTWIYATSDPKSAIDKEVLLGVITKSVFFFLLCHSIRVCALMHTLMIQSLHLHEMVQG